MGISLQKWATLVLMLLMVILTGCMEIEDRIVLGLDGSAVLKETIRVHNELLSFLDDSGKPLMVTYLEKAACEERAKLFHAEAVLRSHSLKTLNGGGKLLETEYYMPNINNLNVINPFLCFVNYKDMGASKVKMVPTLVWASTPDSVNGELMSVRIDTDKRGVDETNFANPSPIIVQKFRNLQPVFKSLMKEFKVSVVFECFAPIQTNFGWRDRNSSPRSCEILSFSGADYDNEGGLLLDNDEIMQELLRHKYSGLNFLRAADTFVNNQTVPVICSRGTPYAYNHTGGRGIGFRPSKKMFMEFFDGKMVQRWGRPEPIKAEFSNFGYDPDTDPRKVPQKDVVIPPTEPAKIEKPVVVPAK